MRSASRRSLIPLRLLLAVTLGCLLAACEGEEAPQPEPRPVLVVRPGDAVAGATAFAGEIRAREESPLSFRVGGNLVERRVDVGDHVDEGDLLAVLDDADLQAQVRASRAQLAAAEAEAGQTMADRARFAQLAEDQLVSRSAADAQNAAAAAAQSQADAARASLVVSRNQATYTQLRAPADGVIASRSAESGQVVGAGQPVFTLAADGVREVLFAVPEGQLDRIEPGQPVLVELWSQDGRRWPGSVREVAPAAHPESRTFAVRATVDAPDDALALGQSARVYVPQPRDRSLSVPLSALQRQGNGAAVFVVDQDTRLLRLQPVEVGAYGKDHVPVRSGLEPGDLVVAAGGHLLRAGQAVRPVDRDNRPVRPGN